ncbi:sorting nexin-5 [Biomphalaria glabrata]|uniref:Sorting nexin-5-like isoform X1 n=2 Tax=Biomphalaria glabrata TaxID=6526 RepID=A0A9W3B167_BIOGL|nr:sorting nexin-5-like isoform X1 [Biomphalaria glabrata]KAI8733992.1 sorting nexin-5-like [Biomphalaria glabrata]
MEDEGEAGASASNSYNQTPLPLFNVEIPEAVKRAENVMFTIHTSVPGQEKGHIVLRQFEDFEWLHHNLIVSNNIEGVIIPPLPVKPLSDPKSAEALSRRQLGDHTRVLRGDQFETDCKAFQKYLQLMLCHHVFGRDKNLASFLTDNEAPVRARVNKGIMNRLTNALDNARKGNHKDVDDYFTAQRHFANEYSKAAKEASLNFNKLLVAQWRLSSQYRILATELTSCEAERDESLVKLNRILKLLSEGCEDEAACYELKSGQGEMTLGLYFDLMARYSESLKDMHFRRTCSLIEFQTAEKAVEKAKPIKKAALQEVSDAAKKSFEASSEQAKKEITSFTQLRLLNSSEALSKYAEIQMKISQDFYSQLFHSRKALLELQL